MKKKFSLSAILLAGGENKRMGIKKAFLKVGGNTFIDIIYRKMDELFSEIIVVTDLPQDFSYLKARITTDLIQNGEKNALRGIHAGLSVASNPACFVVACDMPFLSLSLIKHMSQFALGYDVVVPLLDGYYQPLFAFYNKKALNLIQQRLEEKRYKIVDLYPHFHLKAITEEIVRQHDPLLLSFSNINSPEDYRKIQEYWEIKKENGSSV